MSTEQMTQNEKRAQFDSQVDAMKLGEILPAGTLMMTMGIGTARDDNDLYELSTSMGGSPIVQHKGTGQFFTLSWNDIVNLAVARGIKDPP